MGYLYISEYSQGAAQALEPCVASQCIEIALTSTCSRPFHKSTQSVRLHADEDCSITFAQVDEFAATARDARLSADSTEMFNVGRGLRLAVIANNE